MKLKTRILRWIISHYKVWGVDFESNFPPEFIITKHAEERMVQRCGWNKEVMMKLTIKAWHSNEKVPTVYKNIKEYNVMFGGEKGEYRRLMGKTFIFVKKYRRDIDAAQKKLITVY